MKRRILIGSVIGGISGFLYYKYIGCYTGGCPIKSDPALSTIYGAIIGALVFELMHELRGILTAHKSKKGATRMNVLNDSNDSKATKFENPKRLEELDPRNTLTKAGFQENMVLCDIGAGSGIFSLPAAQISSNDIYALEISDSMIELLKNRMVENKIQNLKIRKVDSDILPLENDICDMALMVTVFHEIADKEFMLGEIKRILKEKGRLMIIEFHKRETPMGPPVDHRISEEDVEEICNNSKFITIEKFTMGDNFYGIIFEA